MIQSNYDRIIIGSGAAGLMCAYLSAQKGKKVLLLDHSNKLAEKIRISGGGRCNFTNIYTQPECFISENSHFCISSLARYTPFHFTELLDKYNITYHEKTLGQLFCDNSSMDIINLLDHLCSTNKVLRQMNCIIKSIEKINQGFSVITNFATFIAESVVIATGGLSIPQIGATGFGYEIANQFGLAIIKPEPALVPLTLSNQEFEYFTHLSGVSFFSEISISNISFKENTLLTHRGLSGPAILQISSYWQKNNQLNINMLPEQNIQIIIQESRSQTKLLSNFLLQFFSARLANSICQIIQIDKPISQLSNKEILKINQFIHNFSLTPTGTLGYKKAEVTKGGVDTRELSSKTMMSNKIEGLYFIGEVVDVTGWLGGYNFQWAWASAFAAANNFE